MVCTSTYGNKTTPSIMQFNMFVPGRVICNYWGSNLLLVSPMHNHLHRYPVVCRSTIIVIGHRAPTLSYDRRSMQPQPQRSNDVGRGR